MKPYQIILCLLFFPAIVHSQTTTTFKAAAAVRLITPDPLLPVSGGVGVPRDVTEKKGDLFIEEALKMIAEHPGPEK